MTNTYGGGPRPLEASDPHEGATIGEFAEWIAYLRADGCPEDAPVRVAKTNIRMGVKKAEVMAGDRLAASLRRRAERRAGTGGRSGDDDPPAA